MTPEEEARLLASFPIAGAPLASLPMIGPPAPPPPAPPPVTRPAIGTDEREASLMSRSDATAGFPPPAPADDASQQQANAAAQAGAQQAPDPTARFGGDRQISMPQFLGMSGGSYTPAHEGKRAGPSTEAAHAAQLDAEGQAVAAHEGVGQQILQGAARTYDAEIDSNNEVADQARNRQLHAAMEQSVAREEMAKIQDAGTRLAEAKVDPGRAWADKSTGSQIALIIGSALAGFGGHPTLVLDQLNRTIDRDVQSQVDAFQRQGKNLDAKRSYFGQIMQETAGDIDKAKAILRDSMVKRAQAMATYTANQVKAAGAGATAAELKAGLAAANTKYMLETRPWMQATASSGKHMWADPETGAVFTTSEKETPGFVKDMRAQGLTSQSQNATAAQHAADKSQKLKEHEDERTFYFNGKPALAKNKVDATRIREQYENADTAIQALNRVIELRKSAATRASLSAGGAASNVPVVGDALRNLLTTEDAATIQSLYTQAGVTWAKSKGMGAWDNGTVKALSDAQGNPATVFSVPEAKLRAMVSEIERLKINVAKAQGVNLGGGNAKVQKAFVEDKK